MTLLSRLSLTEFRNYKLLRWTPDRHLSVVWGPNGSGKTNVLEAVSLLVPGRGLRGARVAELGRIGATAPWAVAGRFETADDVLDVGTGVAEGGGGERRVFLVDGAPPRSQAQIATRISAVWLTPRMDRLFAEGASGRRRFLDRLVWALDPAHAREVAAHDTAMTQRNRLLAGERGWDEDWLAGLEDAIARHAVAVTAARAGLAARLSAALAEGAAAPFPAALMSLACPIAERLETSPALALEDWLRAELAAGRARDRAAGMAALGAHRADMALSDATTGLPAARASTGQQKALLIGVVLGHAALIARLRGFAPLLLLDEPCVHLDATRRADLADALRHLPAQALLTGTDADAFDGLRGAAAFFRTGGDTLVRDPDC
jgi:DNA replication and repair protein RecF